MRAGRLLILLGLLPFGGLAEAAAVDGASLVAWWGLPFAGMLLSIALMPLLAPIFWHHHFGKVALGWSLALLLPFAAVYGGGIAAKALVHTLLAEYLPFIILLMALFTVSGGIYLRGNLHGSPRLNTGLLALGALLASVMGTTGASMLLIRPMIRANDNRRHTVHVFVFFIFIVSNIGGSLTPLGDPPLFLGFLKGVSFFWTAQHLWPETLFAVAVLLALFYALDSYWYRREGVLPRDPTPDSRGFALEGKANLGLLAVVVALVLISGTWKPGVEFDVFGTSL
ncbi:MAG: sodium:proton antiporter, partial [Burkholderiaceae bacterium]|nr:sodium:proton antiporter [Burkholderiaceae bacterium]